MREEFVARFIPNVWMYKVRDHGEVVNVHGKALYVYSSGNLRIPKTTGGIANIKLKQLVAMSFVDNPEGFKFVKCIDGDETNCHYTNLRWVKTVKECKYSPYECYDGMTAREAVALMLAEGLMTRTICSRIKVSPQYVNYIRRQIRAGTKE